MRSQAHRRKASAPPRPRPGLARRASAGLWHPGLRLPRHRATTAHLCSAYPFQAAQGLGGRGIYLGTDELAGGGAFCLDVFELYTRGVISAPNILIVGQVGSGKSSAVKTLLYRTIGVLASPGGGPRWVAVVDPKGEYRPLADALGLEVLRLYRGGPTRLNPLDSGPGGAWCRLEELIGHRSALVAALIASVLRRELSPVEDAVVGWAVAEVSQRRGPVPTLVDVARLLDEPTTDMAERARAEPAELSRSVDAARFALGKLLDRDLRGMFDGPTTTSVDWLGRGVVLDLSAVHQDPEALTLVMIAATAWLGALLAAPEGAEVPRRYQVLEECWALLGSERTAKYLQSCYKLSRAYGVANVAVAHRISDLRAQADDGSSAAKVAMGLLGDTDIRVVFRQATDQVAEATALLDLTATEADLLPRLGRGRALWKVGPAHTSVVQHVIAPGERHITDTDARLLV
ncbi:MAG: ATP-binding protein [Actinomycetota bacterium]|nr:ATP-binding protein [Actinomycetota bacterium]